MAFMTDKQQEALEKFNKNLDQGKRSTEGFNRTDYQHIETAKRRAKHIIRHYQEAIKVLLHIDDNTGRTKDEENN